jgi:DNA (cytosine-5)-methyltransferase 1
VTRRPLLLDLFCKAGGAAVGYARAGFRVVGVDHVPQPRYPFEFILGDALELGCVIGRDFDAIHASPPCQRYSRAQTLRGRDDHPDLIGPTRDVLRRIDRPYVIENVPGAPLLDPIELCGYALGLRLYRHRWFETSFPAPSPWHRPHDVRQAQLGRPAASNEFLQIVGNFPDVARARRDADCRWMTRDELREAIPPAYTRYLGRWLLSFPLDRDGPPRRETKRV